MMRDHNNSLTTQAKPVILAVDDDEDNLLLLRYSLEHLNCSVVCETNGRPVLSLVKSTPPDLILLDILLPGLSGFDVIKILHLDTQLKQIPVIAVTALASQSDYERIMAAGFVDYVAKPYWLDTLIATVCRHLTLDLCP